MSASTATLGQLARGVAPVGRRTRTLGTGCTAAAGVGPTAPAARRAMGRWPNQLWGYQETSVWDPGFNQWGFWFFRVWIPL
jgi:hypothetical protein